MKSLFTLENLNININNIKSLGIGKFDGMHLAHQKLLNSLGKNGAIISIEIDKDRLLTPLKEKSRYALLPIFSVKLNDIKKLSGKEFIELLKDNFPSLSHIVVGYDFRFGKNGAWSAEDLHDLCDFDVTIVKEIRCNNMAVHSSMIGDFIEHGDIKTANMFLGRIYSIQGDIIKGQGIGAKKLYPTINIESKHFILPQNGVYATFCEIDKILYKSVSFIGNRLSTDRNFSVESHILSKNFALTSTSMRVFFVDKIRLNRKFDTLQALKEQIKNDIQVAKEILKNSKF